MKKNLKWGGLCAAVLALALAAGSVPAKAAGTVQFTDVPEGHWASTYIVRAQSEGWVQGVGGGLYAPGQTLSGAEFLTMTANALFPEDMAGQAAAPVWYSPCWETARLYGLDEGSSFRSLGDLENSISRYDMAQIIVNALRAKGVPASEGAVSIPDWGSVPAGYQEAVRTAYSMGILTGKDGGIFAGADTMTRAEAAAVLCRMGDAVQGASGTAPAPTPAPTPGPDAAPVLPNGEPMTEDNVRAIINGLRSSYPEGMRWTNDNSYTSSAMRMTGYGCAGFALICSDAAFGDLPLARTHSSFDDIRVGDMLRVNNDTHSVVVLEKRENSVIVTEGNYNSSIHWDREITRQSLEAGNYSVETRYPQ